MVTTTTLSQNFDIYKENLNWDNFINFEALSNKLFCTFVQPEDLDNFIDNLTRNYQITYNKIFVLESKTNGERVCTYNIELGNANKVPENTILVHRKKETNTLYTINALNELIKELNNGVVDVNYKVNWQHYRNTILLTQQNELKQLKTKIFKIIDL
jgi:hypothetical protein